jgi:hypothetical protein
MTIDTDFLTDTTRPATHNYLSTNYFRLAISRAPTVSYFAQAVSLPSINIAELRQPTILSTNIPVPGNAYTFQPLRVQFIVDETMRSWQEIYNWIKVLGNYKDSTDTLPHHDKYSDITLLITNSAYKAKFEVVFKYAYPSALSELPFSITAVDNVPVLATVDFTYTYYEFNILTSP